MESKEEKNPAVPSGTVPKDSSLSAAQALERVRELEGEVARLHETLRTGGYWTGSVVERERLHVAVCQAVGLLNGMIHDQPESRQAHDILRQTLVDYADVQPTSEKGK